MLKKTLIILGILIATGVATYPIMSVWAQSAGCACEKRHKGSACGAETGKQHGCTCDNDPNTSDTCK